MTVAVICEGANEKNGIWGRNFSKRIFGAETRVLDYLTLVPMYIPFNAEELSEMSERRLMRMFRGALREAEKYGEKVAFSAELCGIVRGSSVLDANFGGYIAEKRGCFFEAMPEVLRGLAPMCGIDLMRSVVCICDKKASKISECIIEEIRFDTKRIVLCTENVAAAEKFCAEFAAETGMYVITIDMRSGVPKGADAVIDTDELKMRLGGDVFSCNPKFGFAGTEAAVRGEDVMCYVRQCDAGGLLRRMIEMRGATRKKTVVRERCSAGDNF